MPGCGNCGCNCIIADERGFAYPVGADRLGNEAIIIPSPDSRCGMFEFVHGNTDCVTSLYPLVSPLDGVTLAGCVIVLSVADDAPVIVAIRVNGVQISSTVVPTGTRIMEWPATAFPLVLDRMDEVDTGILSAGTLLPAVSLQFTVCVPGNAEITLANPTTDPLTSVLWNPAGRGTLGAGQSPIDLAHAATVPALHFYVGSGSNPDSMWLTAADSSRVLGHHRVWPPDPRSVPSQLIGWNSGTDELPATPEDPADVALAVDRATSRTSHRWDVTYQGWLPMADIATRVEMGQAGPHEVPSGPLGFSFFRSAGTYQIDVVGVWEQHNGTGLIVEVVDTAGVVQGTVTLAAGSRSVVPVQPIIIPVPIGGGLAARCANSPSVPGSGVTVVGTFMAAG